MKELKPDKWTPADLDILLTDVIAAVESGEIDSAFDNTEMTSGQLTKSKNTRNYTKNYLSACIRAGINGVSEASRDTALGLVNAFRQMNAESPLDVLPERHVAVGGPVVGEVGADHHQGVGTGASAKQAGKTGNGLPVELAHHDRDQLELVQGFLQQGNLDLHAVFPAVR